VSPAGVLLAGGVVVSGAGARGVSSGSAVVVGVEVLLSPGVINGGDTTLLQCAYNVMSLVIGVAKSNNEPPVAAVYQPPNLLGPFDGSGAGFVALPPASTSWDGIKLPPLASNVTVYVVGAVGVVATCTYSNVAVTGVVGIYALFAVPAYSCPALLLCQPFPFSAKTPTFGSA
jgi:hypothetical protein